MNQTNRADAAKKYLESTGFLQKAAEEIQFEFTFQKAMPSLPWWQVNDYRLGLLPRMRFVNNLGVWELQDARGSRVLGNDIESTYMRWIRRELERNANEDYNDMPAYERLVSKRSMVRTLVATGAGLLIIALAAFLCLGFR